MRRLRWITLAELLAIAAVVISALTFWNGYRERTNSETEHATERASDARRASVLLLRATPDAPGRTLAIVPRSDGQAIQSQTITFPTALGLAPAETSGDARIERDWFAGALVRARKAAAAPDRTVGDGRLPVLVVTHYLSDGDARLERAVYLIGYATEHSFLGGTSVHLRGLAREGAAASDAAGRKRVDSLWKDALPVRKE